MLWKPQCRSFHCKTLFLNRHVLRLLVHFTHLSELCQRHQYAWYPLWVQLVAIATHQEMTCQSLSFQQYRSSRSFGSHSWCCSTPEAVHRDIASVLNNSRSQKAVGVKREFFFNGYINISSFKDLWFNNSSHIYLNTRQPYRSTVWPIGCRFLIRDFWLGLTWDGPDVIADSLNACEPRLCFRNLSNGELEQGCHLRVERLTKDTIERVQLQVKF